MFYIYLYTIFKVLYCFTNDWVMPILMIFGWVVFYLISFELDLYIMVGVYCLNVLSCYCMVWYSMYILSRFSTMYNLEWLSYGQLSYGTNMPTICQWVTTLSIELLLQLKINHNFFDSTIYPLVETGIFKVNSSLKMFPIIRGYTIITYWWKKSSNFAQIPTF